MGDTPEYTLREVFGGFHIVNSAGHKVQQHADREVAEARCKELNERGKANARRNVCAKCAGDLVEAKTYPVLDGNLGGLRAALDRGELDADLLGLLEAEAAGKNRSGAVAALESRMASIRE